MTCASGLLQLLPVSCPPSLPFFLLSCLLFILPSPSTSIYEVSLQDFKYNYCFQEKISNGVQILLFEFSKNFCSEDMKSYTWTSLSPFFQFANRSPRFIFINNNVSIYSQIIRVIHIEVVQKPPENIWNHRKFENL